MRLTNDGQIGNVGLFRTMRLNDSSPDNFSRQRVEIGGRVVEVRLAKDGREELFIDDRPYGFFKVGNTYSLEVDAYAPPHRTLMDAARFYVERLAATADKRRGRDELP